MSSVEDSASDHSHPTTSESEASNIHDVERNEEEGYDGQEEDPYVPLTLDEIPGILEDLRSRDEDTALNAARKLDAACMRQEEFMAGNLDILDVLQTIQLAKTLAFPATIRFAIVDYLASLATTDLNARVYLSTMVQDIVELITIPDDSHLYRLTALLNAIVQDVPSSHPAVLDALKELYKPILETPEEGEIDAERAAPLVDAFNHIFVFGEDDLQRLFVQARAVMAIIVSSNSTSTPLRQAVANSLSTLVDNIQKIRDWMPEEEVELKNEDCHLIGLIFIAVFALLDGCDKEVESKVVDFLNGVQDQYGPALNAVLEDPPAMRKFLLTIANKPPNTLGSRDYMLTKACEHEDMVPLVVKGFEGIWVDETIPVDIIIRLFGGLSSSFLDHRKYACEGGLCTALVQRLSNSETPEDRVKLLKAFDELVEEQLIGAYIVKGEGVLAYFVNSLKDPTPKVRTLSSSIIRKTLDARLDDVPQRPIATQYLTSDQVLLTILEVARSPDPVSSSAAFDVLGEILSGEDGTETFGYEEELGSAPPSSPVKDLIVTSDLTNYTAGLLAKSETAVSALFFLSHACWGYPRGHDLIRDALKPLIPTADVFFFNNLYGDFVSRASGRRKRAVAQAAVDAGALERVSTLLEQEYDTVEARRAAVEGYRVIVAAPGVDSSIARKNPALPRVLGKLASDGSYSSLEHVGWTMNLASDDSDPDAFAGWGEFASPNVVRALLVGISTPVEEFGEVEREGLTDEEYVKREEERRANVAKAQETYTRRRTIIHEILSRLKPILRSYSEELVAPLFEEGVKTDEAPFLQLADAYGQTDSGNPNHPAEALLSAVETFLASQPPISLCQSVVAGGPTIAAALHMKGLTTRIIHALEASCTSKPANDADESETSLEGEPDDAFSLLATIVDAVSDAHQSEIKTAFFASPGAVAAACKILASKDIYVAFAAAGHLLRLLKGFPDGAKALQSTDAYATALRLFDHKELDGFENEVGGLVGALSSLDEAKTIDMVKQLISQLTPPLDAEEASREGENRGRKKGGGKKKYKPRFSETQVWERLGALFDSDPPAKDALTKAGVIGFAQRSIMESKSDDVRTIAILSLSRLGKGDKGRLQSFSDVVHLLAPLLAEPDSTAEACLTLVNTFIDEGLVDVLIEASIHSHILRLCSANPIERDYLFNAISGLLATDDGYRAVATVLQAEMTEEQALEDERNWGYSPALRQLAANDPGVGEKRLAGEEWAIQYALRLLNTDDPQLIVKGALLAGDQAFFVGESAYLLLKKIGVNSAFFNSRLEVLKAAAEEPFQPNLEEDDTTEARAEHLELMKRRKDYLPHFQTAITLATGGQIPNYTPEYGF